MQAAGATGGSTGLCNRAGRFCATVNGETETRHEYTYAGGRSFVKVDCETSTTVYEGGPGQAQQSGQPAAGAVFQCPDRQTASRGDL